MRRIIFFLIVFTVCYGVSPSLYAANVFSEKNTLDMEALFSRINATPPSTVAVEEYTKIINDRRDCFSQNFNYSKRARICMEQYEQDIVSTARKNISGRPQIGDFIKNISYCPIMYNLCEGQQDPSESQNQKICITFERQCIDHMLDEYWRGVPLYDNMQLRIE